MAARTPAASTSAERLSEAREAMKSKESKAMKHDP